MSANATVARRSLEAFNAFMRGTLSSEAYAATFDPEIEVVWRGRQPYPDVPPRLRIEEILRFSEQYRDGWADLTAEPLELIELPGGRVLTLVRQAGRGRHSDVPIVIHFFELLTVRKGKVCRIEYYRHRAEALAAASLGGSTLGEDS